MAQEMMEIQYENYRSGDTTKNIPQLNLILTHVEKALSLNCNLPLVQFTLGNVLSELKIYDRSILAYQTALVSNSKAKESVHRVMESTVVDICVPPFSFNSLRHLFHCLCHVSPLF